MRICPSRRDFFLHLAHGARGTSPSPSRAAAGTNRFGTKEGVSAADACEGERAVAAAIREAAAAANMDGGVDARDRFQ